MAGTWGTLGGASGLSNGPANAGTMLLLTDGTVLCHDEPNTGAVSGSNRWYKLSPDSSGSYENGSWTRLQDGPNSPLYFACGLLNDGRVFIAGGEYNGTRVIGDTTVAFFTKRAAGPRALGWDTSGGSGSCGQ